MIREMGGAVNKTNRFVIDNDGCFIPTKLLEEENMKNTSKEFLNDAEDRAIAENFPTEKDMLLLRVADEYPRYKNVVITSLKSDMKITFNTGDFVRDFNDAIAEGRRIMSLGEFETTRHEMSMNSFSGGMLLTSSCDDFLMDSKNMYSYVYSTKNPDDFDVIGVKS